MSKDIIVVKGPYVLEKGQGLLDQAPFNKIIPTTADKFNLSPAVLNRQVVSASNRFADLPRLPYSGKTTSSSNYHRYQQLGDDLKSTYPETAKKIVTALKEVGNALVSFPNWLRYLRVTQQFFPKSYSYDTDGSWLAKEIFEEKNQGDQNKTTREIERTRMEAALSYPYWAYLHQVRVGVIEFRKIDPCVLRTAEVTALLRRYEDKVNLSDQIEPISPAEAVRRDLALGEREWQLVAAPENPIALPARPQESIYAYRMRLMAGLGD